MTIKYRAVHTHNTWRKVNNHRSLDSAISGNDGAKNLLLQKGRVGKKWIDYGPVQCVFVWEDGSAKGTAMRLKPGSMTEIETAAVPVQQLEEWEQKGGCVDKDIDGCFR